MNSVFLQRLVNGPEETNKELLNFTISFGMIWPCCRPAKAMNCNDIQSNESHCENFEVNLNSHANLCNCYVIKTIIISLWFYGCTWEFAKHSRSTTCTELLPHATLMPLSRLATSYIQPWHYKKQMLTRGLFLKSPENFSGLKSQLSNLNLLSLKSWSFNMILM